MYKVGGSIPGVFNLHVGQETEPSFPIHWSVNVIKVLRQRKCGYEWLNEVFWVLIWSRKALYKYHSIYSWVFSQTAHIYFQCCQILFVLEMTVCDVMRVVDYSLEFNSPLFLQYSQMITAKLFTFFLYFTYYNNMWIAISFLRMF